MLDELGVLLGEGLGRALVVREQHIAAGDDSLDVGEILALERLAQLGHLEPVAADVDRTEQGDVAGQEARAR